MISATEGKLLGLIAVGAGVAVIIVTLGPDIYQNVKNLARKALRRRGGNP